jgi:hypothetical protein
VAGGDQQDGSVIPKVMLYKRMLLVLSGWTGLLRKLLLVVLLCSLVLQGPPLVLPVARAAAP